MPEAVATTGPLTSGGRGRRRLRVKARNGDCISGTLRKRPRSPDAQTPAETTRCGNPRSHKGSIAPAQGGTCSPARYRNGRGRRLAFGLARVFFRRKFPLDAVNYPELCPCANSEANNRARGGRLSLVQIAVEQAPERRE